MADALRQLTLRQSAGNDFHELELNCRQGHQRLTRLIPSSVNRLRFTLLKVIRSAPVLSHLRPIAKRTSAVRPNARGWPSPGLHSAIGRHWNGAREMARTDQEAIRFDDGQSHPAPAAASLRKSRSLLRSAVRRSHCRPSPRFIETTKRLVCIGSSPHTTLYSWQKAT